jgi:hypothetical protein
MSRLTDGLVPKPDPTLALDTQASPQQVPEGDQLVTIYMTSAVRTSAGPGPGVRTLPAHEANLLVARRFAVHGDQPPRSFVGEPEGPDRPFDDNWNKWGSRDDGGLRR